MKINPFDPSSRPSAPAQQRPPAAQEADFARLLAESQGKKPAASGGGAPLEPLTNNALAGRILAARPAEEAGPARRQLENALDQMELYAAALGDTGRGLKDIAPLADGLEKAADRLSQLSRKLPESDPLKGLSNEASILAAVEALKFKRGDYI